MPIATSLPRLRPLARAVGLVLALAVASGGCGDDSGGSGAGAAEAGGTGSAPEGTDADGGAAVDPVDLPVLRIAASDYTLEVPAGATAGLTVVEIANDGDEPHQAGLFRLEDGVTQEQWLAALAGFDFTSTAVALAGPNSAEPGAVTRAVVDLQPGRYVVACLIPSTADGVPHVLKGMVTTLDVTEPLAPGPSWEDLPAADVEVALDDHEYTIEGELGPDAVVDIRNDGTEVHELVVVGLPGATTIDEVVAFGAQPILQPLGDQPYTDVGGITLLAPGGRARIDLGELALPPGRYAFACFVPAADGEAHLAKGMHHELEVA